MRKQSLPKRFVSAAFAAALAVTMVPLAAPGAGAEQAFADEAGAGARVATPGAQISVTSPFYVDFGSQSAPYDVANPTSEQSQAALTSKSYFRNGGATAIALDQVECMKPSEWTNAGNSHITDSAGTGTMDSSTDLFSFWTNENAEGDPNLKFGYATNGDNKLQRYNETINERIEMAAGDTMKCAYRLNLDSAGAKVNPAAANNAEERRNIGTVKVTFSTNILTGAATSAAPTSQSFNSMIIQDNSEGHMTSGQIYNADQIKAHAKDLSMNQKPDGTNTSVYYPMYKRFVEDVQLGEPAEEGGVAYPVTTEYTAKVYWIAAVYPVRIIGICQDHLASSDHYGSTSEYAGLSFLVTRSANTNKFVSRMNAPMTYTNAAGEEVTGTFSFGGWADSEYRTKTVDEATKVCYKDYLAPVVKRSTVTYTLPTQPGDPVKNTKGYCETEDKFFLLSAYEVWGEAMNAYQHTINRDGFFQYQWFSKATNGISLGTANPLLIPYELDKTNVDIGDVNPVSPRGFRLRSAGESLNNAFKVIGENGTYKTGVPDAVRNHMLAFAI